MLTSADHFAHREAGGLVVDLYWSREHRGHEFRVEVEDEREGVRFVLHPATGRDAIDTFHHPFASPHALSPGGSREEGAP